MLYENHFVYESKYVVEWKDVEVCQLIDVNCWDVWMILKKIEASNFVGH